ncbi:protein-disulfide reductase DsbD domain-containing protein [Niveibacterium sp. SC-1]|uniref:protein-disulfide reductase DsbD family protein n=1 Tax=Niveibacterium sp. SC-1 TaxID=3135646 RepID=UPI00311FC0EC
MNKHAQPPLGLLLAVLFTLLCALLGTTRAQALESAPVTSPHATVSLVSESDRFEADKPIRLGLRFVLAKGWHVYWRNPGDAGQPPQIDWKLAAGAQAGEIEWPAPVRYRQGPVMNYVFEREVTLPVALTLPTDGGIVEADADWLVCADVCIPEKGHFRLTLQPGTPAASAQAPLFVAADARHPVPAPFATGIAADGALSVAAKAGDVPLRAAWFFPEKWGAVEHAAPQPFQRAEAGFILRLKPGQVFDPKAHLKGVLLTKDEDGLERAYQVDAAPGAVDIGRPIGVATVDSESPAQDDGTSLLRWIALAFLGGLILNAMPCVFPVLAIKALQVARAGGAARREVRQDALAYTAGVLGAFLVLALVFLGLRGAGIAAGWGFQFQSPAFVIGMAWLMFAIGLSLSGVLEFGSRTAGLGQSLAARGGLAGSFFTGLLAVIVATPCTAPFMGAAIAAALSGSAAQALTIFLAMGLGLAAPYASLALFPGIARRLPRPGRWMLVFRQAMAFPMYGAAIWLLWVASTQAGDSAVLLAALGMLALALAAWAWHWHARHPGAAWKGVAGMAVIGLVLVSLRVAGLQPETAARPLQAQQDTAAEPWSDARLDALRAEGKPVFVNMTAAWCVTCLVNEKVALGAPAVAEAFSRAGVTYLKGDWTRADPAITRFLRNYRREGVPLYVFFPAGNAAPVVLPQILTEKVVLDHLSLPSP